MLVSQDEFDREYSTTPLLTFLRTHFDGHILGIGSCIEYNSTFIYLADGGTTTAGGCNQENMDLEFALSVYNTPAGITNMF